MSKTYAIFNKPYDCEIWVNLKMGTLDSIDTIRELISDELDNDPSLEGGYVESYPFFQADWVVVGGRMDSGFDYDQIQEVENDWGTFEKEKEIKQFECFWGDGYRGKDNKSTLAYHNQYFFNEFRGYEEEHIEKVNSLEINEQVYLTQMGEEHWVRRIA